MKKYYSNHSVETKVHKKMSKTSEMITQMVYGDAFSIIKKERDWFKIKIKEDGYIGFIKNKKTISYVKSTYKVCKLFANIYKYPNSKKTLANPCIPIPMGRCFKFEFFVSGVG